MGRDGVAATHQYFAMLFGLIAGQRPAFVALLLRKQYSSQGR